MDKPEDALREVRAKVMEAFEIHVARLPADWNPMMMEGMATDMKLALQKADHVLALYPDGSPPAELNPEDEGTLPPWQE